MKKNLTIGLPESGVVLCEGLVGFHAGCTDTQEGAYDVIANHNNWKRILLFSLLRFIEIYSSKTSIIHQRVHTLTKLFRTLQRSL